MTVTPWRYCYSFEAFSCPSANCFVWRGAAVEDTHRPIKSKMTASLAESSSFPEPGRRFTSISAPIPTKKHGITCPKYHYQIAHNQKYIYSMKCIHDIDSYSYPSLSKLKALRHHQYPSSGAMKSEWRVLPRVTSKPRHYPALHQIILSPE